MPPTLQEELQQRKPFATLEEEAMVSLVRTFRVVADAGDLLFKAHGISPAQYNVLRILRGAASCGMGRNDIRERLISRMPDVTRLLDRMEEAGLVRRERDVNDRRCVPTYLTDRGAALLETLEEPIAALHREHFGHLSQEQLRTLIDLLTLVRNRPDP